MHRTTSPPPSSASDGEGVLQLGLWQSAPLHGQPDENLERLTTALEEGSTAGGRADLVLLPELFVSGYLFDERSDLLAASLDSEQVTRRLRPLAARHRTTLVVGFAERSAEELFNSVAVIDGDGLRAVYRKLFLGGIDHRFEAGADPVTFELRGVHIGLALCLDLWFPELTREYLDRGVDLLLHPSAFGGSHTLELARVRARESAMVVATCNRTGAENHDGVDAQFCGRSQVVLPDGGTLAHAPDDGEHWLRCAVRRQPEPRRLLGVDLEEQRRRWRSVSPPG